MARSANVLYEALRDVRDDDDNEVFTNRNIFIDILPEDREKDIKKSASVVIEPRDEVREQVFGGHSILRNTEYYLTFMHASPAQVTDVMRRAIRCIRGTRRLSHHELLDAQFAWDKKLQTYARQVRVIMFR